MINEFCSFYKQIKEISYMQFCEALGFKKTDLEGKVDWLMFHSNTGQFIVDNHAKAIKLHHYICKKALANCD
ncbi:MAG: hypothetical protein RLY43_1988 [Bacteroidota bacterium]|jgi:hypothetical protein